MANNIDNANQTVTPTSSELSEADLDNVAGGGKGSGGKGTDLANSGSSASGNTVDSSSSGYTSIGDSTTTLVFPS